jgi:hypothetical protein
MKMLKKAMPPTHCATLTKYKGSTEQLPPDQQTECDILSRIRKVLGESALGDVLLERWNQLNKGQADAGYFYCPYIPLQKYGVASDKNLSIAGIKFATRYDKKHK